MGGLHKYGTAGVAADFGHGQIQCGNFIEIL
jgi:hypothetical protein